MITILLGFIVVLAGVFLLSGFAFSRQRETYEQMCSILERDREEARHEAQVFRRLVLPVYDKVEQQTSSGALPGTSPPEKSGAVTQPPATPLPPLPILFNRRLPWRIRWKAAARDSNTKQKGTDALAAALRAQKVPEEKKHA